MRTWIVVGMLVGGALISGCHKDVPPPAAPEAAAASVGGDLPVQKPGLWKQTISLDDSDDLQTLSMCIDAKADEMLADWGRGPNRKGCKKNEMTHQPDGSWKFSSICPGPNGSQSLIDGTVVGDFNSKYQIREDTDLRNAPPEMVGAKTKTIDAEWVGPCPEGMRPGDMQQADGTRFNMLDIIKAQSKGPAPAGQ